jgi:hypothetical protein
MNSIGLPVRTGQLEVREQNQHAGGEDCVIGADRMSALPADVKVRRKNLVLGSTRDLSVEDLYCDWKRPGYLRLSSSCRVLGSAPDPDGLGDVSEGFWF